jgi:hypothetical protein
MTDLVTLHVLGAAQRGTLRCRIGTYLASTNMGPASSEQRYTLLRVRDTRLAS